VTRRLKLHTPARLDAAPARCIVAGCPNPPRGLICTEHAAALAATAQPATPTDPGSCATGARSGPVEASDESEETTR
jgi:hypothetical protein